MSRTDQGCIGKVTEAEQRGGDFEHKITKVTKGEQRGDKGLIDQETGA